MIFQFTSFRFFLNLRECNGHGGMWHRNNDFQSRLSHGNSWRCVRCGRCARGAPGESGPCCRTFLHRCPPGFGAHVEQLKQLTQIQVANEACLKYVNLASQNVQQKFRWETMMKDSLRAWPPIGWIASTKSSKVISYHHPEPEKNTSSTWGPELKNSNKHQQAIKK